MAWFTARLLRVPKNLPHLSRILICCGGVHLHSRLQALKLEASRPDAPPLIRKSKLQSFFAKSKNADYPQDFCSFLDSCPSSYHAVDSAKRLLQYNGFQEVSEKDSWSDTVTPGGKYFVVRNDVSGSSLIAFTVGKLWKPGNPFAMIATHVDSPCFKVKPYSDASGAGYQLVGVQTYGGGLWHTWLDRDLGVAGRVFVRTPSGQIESRLVDVREPLLRIPSLAAHYHEHNPLRIDTESHLWPVACLQVNRAQVDRTGKGERADEAASFKVFPWETASAEYRHLPNLVARIAEKLRVHPLNIAEWDLQLYDTQKATIGGTDEDFVFGRGIDNLMMTYCGLVALSQSIADPASLASDSTIRVLSLFDNEEISSRTGLGGASTFLPNTLRRLSMLPQSESTPAGKSKLLSWKQSSPQTASANPDHTIHEQALARSFLISADMIHGVHPLFPNNHEVNHRPLLNSGLVFYSSSSRYLTKNTPGHLLLSEIACRTTPPLAEDANRDEDDNGNRWDLVTDSSASAIPSSASSSPSNTQGSAAGVTEYQTPPRMQIFTNRNNVTCGSTLGPILAPLLGVRTVEVGNAQLSMHSIREMAGARDLENAVRIFRGFWEGWGAVEATISVD